MTLQDSTPTLPREQAGWAGHDTVSVSPFLAPVRKPQERKNMPRLGIPFSPLIHMSLQPSLCSELAYEKLYVLFCIELRASPDI